MAKLTKPKTQEQKDRDTKARLLRTYNITLAEYGQMLEEQNFGCAICGRPPGDKRLHVDHDHAFAKRKIAAVKLSPGKWTASTHPSETPYYVATGSTKTEAKNVVKRLLLRGSVRGLLCWQDNTALQKYRDCPNRLEAAADYIRRFHAKHAPLGA